MTKVSQGRIAAHEGATSSQDHGRRKVLKGLAVGAGVAALGFPNIVRAQKGGEVYVRTSGGSYQDALQKGTWSVFEAKTGIRVVPVAANTAKMLAMVQAGEGGLDLIAGNEPATITLRNQGALEKLDKSKFEFTDLADITPVTDYYLGYSVFAEVLVYNKEAFPSRHPGSWKEFWDIDTFPGPRSLQDAKAIAPNLEFALLADGVSRANLYPIDVDRAFKKLTEIKPHIPKFFDSGALGASMIAEKTVVATSLWANRAQVLIDKGAPLGIEWNEGMRMLEAGAILKSAKNLDNAYRLLDFELSPEPQANTLPKVLLSPANKKAFNFIDAKVAATLPTAPKNREIGFDNSGAWWVEHRAEVLERWQEFLLT